MAVTEQPPAITRLGELEARRLELLVPIAVTPQERILMAQRCRDTDSIPKVAHAGEVIQESDGTRVQIMHNGIKVLAGGYYGDWMQDLIARCRGHHEPQEERIFAEVVPHLPANGVMFELGGYWSYYSIWFLSQSGARRSYIVEPDPAHLAIGRTNARLNGCEPVFIHAYVGPQPRAPEQFTTESSGIVELSCVSVSSLMATHGIEHLDILHCDAQGTETSILESCAELFSTVQMSWVFVSTHTHHISGDPLTHQRCLSLLLKAGATIVAEHDVQESFSGDGLIVAKFGALPEGWVPPVLSYNRYSDSLFRNPLYDLAAASNAARPAKANVTPPSVPPPISAVEE
jgi:FkbM family methyltransferase